MNGLDDVAYGTRDATPIAPGRCAQHKMDFFICGIPASPLCVCTPLTFTCRSDTFQTRWNSRAMKTPRCKIQNSVLGCCILLLTPILCFLFGWVDFGPFQAAERTGVRPAQSDSRNFQNGSFWARRSPAPSRTPAPVPECPRNGSLADIPRDLPAAHRLFLQHKHCRAFPRLLGPRACPPDLFLLLAVKSTAAQIDRRTALRNTWARAGTVEGKRVRLVFLLGRSQDGVRGYPLQRLLEQESRRFGDILQWDFADSFFNLTLKEVHFLRWFGRECRSARFVLKGDDDVFVHTGNLLEFLRDKSPSAPLFAGDIIHKARPIRRRQTKYFIPVEMFPKNEYPPYAGGGGYLMSRQTVIGLDLAAQDTDLFPIDDVFVGMCLEKMKVQLVFHDGFRTFGYRQQSTPFDPCIYRDLMLVHKLTPTEMWVMWSMVNDPNLICARKSLKL
ncbi:hypothetical protein ANANG_G00186560 [Anguilla anguilla]|uniref:Hexosyltransferase n=1 Tax=Anguilla anguilla TaxID=7936 RepID=A0A9D3RR62_ANGAN|nr:hypothetical protein ANANG_G00186560 [Anguilla anguilla]